MHINKENKPMQFLTVVNIFLLIPLGPIWRNIKLARIPKLILSHSDTHTASLTHTYVNSLNHVKGITLNIWTVCFILNSYMSDSCTTETEPEHSRFFFIRSARANHLNITKFFLKGDHVWLKIKIKWVWRISAANNWLHIGVTTCWWKNYTHHPTHQMLLLKMIKDIS